MSFLVPIALFGWLPVVLLLFLCLPPRRAVVAAFLLPWLFLPMASFGVQGIPDYTKMTAACYGVLLATLLFDAQRFLSYRLHWVDFWVIGLCLVPVVSAISFGLGAYDGVSKAFDQGVAWLLPYFLGRLYFRTQEEMRVLVLGMIVGGLIYVPLCLLEMRMSPQLHNWVYGYHQHTFGQTRRGDGWRPMVFMQHGLAVAVFMWSAAIMAWVVWRSGEIRQLRGIPMGVFAIGLVLVAFACRSTGASMLGIFAIALYEVWRRGLRWVLVPTLLLPLFYVVFRVAGSWSGDLLLDIAGLVSEGRAQSLLTRFRSEDAIRNLLSGNWIWGTNRFVYAGYRTPEGWPVIADAMWLIMFCCHGLVGLGLWLGVHTLPPLLVVWHMRKKKVVSGDHQVIACVLVLSIWTIDSLVNAMPNPIYVLMLGGMVGLSVSYRKSEVAQVGARQKVSSRRPSRLKGAPQGSGLAVGSGL